MGGQPHSGAWSEWLPVIARYRQAIQRWTLPLPIEKALLGKKQVSLRRFFGWQATVEMGASIVVDDIDEAELADQIASFLWDHRHTFGEK
jgi:hypothetical protein